MNSLTLTYDDLWAYYKQAQEDVQREILKQLDLDNFLPRVSPTVRSDVLKSAPQEIKARFQPTSLEGNEYKKQLILMFGGRRK